MKLETEAGLEALRAFGVEPRGVEPAGSGTVNRHVIVDTGTGRLVLRQYRADRSRAAVDYEHRLLAHALGRGWPVATALAAPEGSSLVEVGGALFALFPFLPGEPASHESLGHKRIKGRLLARLHHDLRDFDSGGQRPGFGRAWELDLFVQAAGVESFNALLAGFGREHADLATAIRREKYRNLRELARLGYGDLPISPVHCDFHHDNLLFDGARLTGLLDFDHARLDAPIYDIAMSLTLECLEPPGYDAIDLRMARAFIEGYAGHRRLAEAEARLLTPLVRAAVLWLCMFRMLQWHAGEGERPVRSIQRSVERRFPALLARAPRLTELALAVTV